MTDRPALRVRTVASVQQLGPEWDPCFAAAADPQTTRAWYEAVEAAALPDGAVPMFVLAEAGPAPLLCLPLLRVGRRGCQSLSTPYTTAWQPISVPDLPDAACAAAFAAIGRHLRPYPVIRLEALDGAAPHLPPMLAGLRRAGRACRRFDHFGNWRGAAPAGWAAYLAARPGALRETIKRKTRAALRDPSVQITTHRDAGELAQGRAAYEAVYAQSWKEPEPFPAFNQRLLERFAPHALVRLFVLHQGDRPIAAQYWTVLAGRATVLKLAHVQDLDKLSPGTVLTAAAIRHLLDEEGVIALDFGRGDDPYKQAWTGERRQKIGLLALQPLRPAGLGALLRHDAGRLSRAWRAGRSRPGKP